ncbi:PC4 and SFRS1-interacting protein [Venturia canescens]|uniref:PC4 and SFRS1-interacting protein n=1 Tax=Venturia canescens TaxID=32260 RepID=UPI001C9C6EFA|nr:PC4 and SFRS1-interacting protein [Venturia canescens]
MVKLTKKFFAGDKVFAKVRGYPAWPARIEGVTDANTKNAKYNVYFYGTGETAVCKVEELFVYLDNKDKFTKPLKRKIFHDGIIALEKELKSDEGKAASLEDLKVLASEPALSGEASEKNSATEALGPAVDSDMESGPLVIDEGDKKKSVKRRTLSATPNNPDTPEAKKKRGRAKGSLTPADSTPKQESTAGDSQGEESSPGKEVVSRSGRKIKPKRFADFSSSEEAETTDKNENSTRSRGKSKVDESNENQASPSAGRKKIMTEKENKKTPSKEGAIQRKKYKLRWLRVEAQLLELDAQIKSNLGLDRADADKCLQAMDDMLALSIDPLMLKKHPQIVETVKRLRRYIGNLADWKLSEEEVTTFKLKAEQIRQKAEHIYNKFKAMFTVPEGQSFWQSFSDQVLHFKELTKDMPEEKMLSLMADPACPDGGPGLEGSESTTATATSTTNEESAMETRTVSESEAEPLPTRCASPVETPAK